MNNAYMQFSNCVLVKGYGRSVVYDLQRMRYEFVANEFADILIDCNYKISLETVEPDLKAFLDTLVYDDWGIYTNNQIASLFPKLNLEWDTFSKITNTHIDLKDCSMETTESFRKILKQCESLICKDYQINFFCLISRDDLEEFLGLFNTTSVNSILLALPYFEISKEDLDSLFKLQPRLNSIFFYSAPFTKYGTEKVNYTSNGLEMRLTDDVIADYFTTNIYLFTEAQSHNTYYNRKLCIDTQGNVKNTPNQDRSFGNIHETALTEIINQAEFQALWEVNKDKIDVCRDCEFRYMCVDSCCPIQRKDGSWFRQTECNYNPYINKWKTEVEYKTLQECGILVDREKFAMDQDKLMLINQELWR